MTGEHPEPERLVTEPLGPEVRAHLADCPSCRITRKLLIRYGDEPPPEAAGRTPATIDEALERDLAAARSTFPLDDGPDLDAGRHILQRWVGTGPRGAVYAVFDRERQRRLALKMVRPTDPRGSRVCHPYLAPVLDVAAAEPFYVTRELLDGGDLLAACRSAPPDRIVQWVGQIAAALAALHTAGEAHGALKPQNVRVDDGGRLLVVDAGLGGYGEPSPWAGPEADGPTVAGDWYALGTILVHCAPQLAQGDPTDPSSLAGLVERMCDPEPGERPTDAEVLGVLLVNRGATGLDATRYRELGELGRGGMGEVLRVYDPVLGRVVALKRLSPRLASGDAAAARFVTEARVTAQLQHPGIVPVHELARLPNGAAYFTMKEVVGRTLAVVSREVHDASRDGWAVTASGWSLPRLIGAYHRVCEAVAYAHHRGVVHRDLKPSNVMIGDYGEVLVVDWGLAKRLDDPESAPSIDLEPDGVGVTRVGQVAGTHGYMPEEQRLGQLHRIGPPTDVFALGAVLYEILAGQAPFAAGSGYPAVRTVRSDVPPELAAITEKALRPAPEDRYPDAGALARDIEAWQTGQWVGAYRYSWVERAERVIRPFQAPLAVGTVALGLLVAGSWAAKVTIDADAQQAVRDRAQMDVQQAQLALEAGDRVRAEVFAAGAVDADDRPEGRGILALLGRRWGPRLVEGREIHCDTVSWSDDRVLCGGGGIWTAGSVEAPAAVWPGSTALGAGVLVGAPGRITQVDAVSGAIRDELRIDGTPSHVLLTGDGRIVWSEGDQVMASGSLGSPVVDLQPCGADGVLILTRQVWLWRPGSETAPVELPIGELATSAACSPDGTRLALGVGSALKIWQLDPLQELAEPASHNAVVRAVAWSGDDRLVASADDDGNVRLWSYPRTATRGRELARLPGHVDPRLLAFDPSGKLLAVAGGDRVRIWDTSEWGGPRELDNMEVPVNAVRWRPNGNLVSLDDHGNLRLWTVTTPTAAAGRTPMRIALRDLALSPDGLAVAVVGLRDDWFGVRDLGAGGGMRWDQADQRVNAVAWSPIHPLVVSGGKDGSIRTWTDTGEPDRTWAERGSAPIETLVFSGDGQVLVAHDGAGKVRLFTAPRGTPLPLAEDAATAVAVDPLGERLALGRADGNVEIVSLTGEPSVTLHGNSQQIVGIAFSPDGTLLATAGQDHTCRVLDAVDGQQIAILLDHERGAADVAFSADGSTLATGGREGRIVLWDVGAMRIPEEDVLAQVSARYGAHLEQTNLTFPGTAP